MCLTFAILCVFYVYFMCAAIGEIINDDDNIAHCCRPTALRGCSAPSSDSKTIRSCSTLHDAGLDLPVNFIRPNIYLYFTTIIVEQKQRGRNSTNAVHTTK